MIQMDHQQLSELFTQDDATPAFSFTGISIDSRNINQGNLFVAIRGDHFDGHEYAAHVHEKGAVAVIVERSVETELPQILVPDTREALGVLANYWRNKINSKVVSITGSNGKTTVKEMLGRILKSQGETLITKGNFNNDIGVPLTLFNLNESHQYAVIEMGANHLHEIEYLMSIAQPDIVYVNNAQAAHVEGFGSQRGVIKAKGEMYQFCEDNAQAIFNNDEPAVDYWKSIVRAQQTLSFSMRDANADIKGDAELSHEGIALKVQYREESQEFRINVHGAHNAQNALAAISLALGCGITLKHACLALEGFDGVDGRQQFVNGTNNSRLIDDSYNANPASLVAAIDVLCALKGKHWLALGDMAELGEESQAMHIESVNYAYQHGVEQFFALGQKSCQSATVFGEQGFCFSRHDEMARFIAARLAPDVNLLVKGSRSAGMDKLVKTLSHGPQLNQPASSHTAGENHAL